MVMSPGTFVTLSNATGFCGSETDDRDADA